jgi:hypothetical protein
LQEQFYDLLFARTQANCLFLHLNSPLLGGSWNHPWWHGRNVSRTHSIHNATLRHFLAVISEQQFPQALARQPRPLINGNSTPELRFAPLVSGGETHFPVRKNRGTEEPWDEPQPSNAEGNTHRPPWAYSLVVGLNFFLCVRSTDGAISGLR